MTDQERISLLLLKAEESLRGARVLLSENMPDFSVSRAYYAMFYVAEAALLSKGLEFSKHSGVIAAFKREFVNGGTFPDSLHKSLRKGFDYRMQGDYGVVSVTHDEANAILLDAAGFVEMVRDYLKK